MDASLTGNLGLYLLGLLIGLVAWVFNRETTRTNNRVEQNTDRLNNHSERLAKLDGKTERE